MGTAYSLLTFFIFSKKKKVSKKYYTHFLFFN